MSIQGDIDAIDPTQPVTPTATQKARASLVRANFAAIKLVLQAFKDTTNPTSIQIGIGDLTTVITTGAKPMRYVETSYKKRITGWHIQSPDSTTIQITTKINGTAVDGTEKVKLTSQLTNSDLTLTTWTNVALDIGDELTVSVDTNAGGAKNVHIIYYIERF